MPHFTGPIALAALVHVLCAQPTPALMEVTGIGPQELPHLPQAATFRDGKLWPAARPGLGVVFDPAGAELVAEISERSSPIPLFRRPDGSFTNW